MTIASSSVYMMFGMEGCGDNFHATELQHKFDNMAAVGDLVENLDANPDTDFNMDPSLQDKIETFNINVTDLVPGFVEDIPFGTHCQWGEGASYNLVASLIYLACGVLLCCTPKPNSIYGGTEEPTSNNETNISGSAGDEDLAAQNDAKIV